VLGGLALLGFLKYESAQGAESGLIIASARQALESGNAYRSHLGALQRAGQALRDSARSQTNVARLRGLLVAKLDTALSQAVTQRDSLRIVLVQRDTLKAQLTLAQATAHAWEMADRADSMGKAVAEARVADLERNLTATLGVAECRLLGLHFLPRCPSRTAVGLLGLGTGALAVLVLKH